MDIKIVEFPETRVAAIEHHGPPETEYESTRKLIEWRIANGLPPGKGRTFGIHYTNPRAVLADQHRVDFCVSVSNEVQPNPQQVVNKVIPGGRCAFVRHIGSRENVLAADYLLEVWLPASGETRRDFPVFFHYVNVGPGIKPEEMITEVYLPIK